LNGKNIQLERTNWWEDSTWESVHTVGNTIELLVWLYKYGTAESLDDNDIIWNLVSSGVKDNGCDIELAYSEINDDDDIPSDILNDDGEIDVWELRDYTGYTEEKQENVDFEDVIYQYILFKFNDVELKLNPAEINDLVCSDNIILDDQNKKNDLTLNENFIDNALAEHNAHEEGFEIAYDEIEIGEQIWMSSNLNVDKFRNGDSIYEAKSSAEWIKANNEKKPAFCYYNFDQKNNHNYSKYYNFYAVIDKRGLAPVSWEIPTLEDYNNLFTTIDSKAKFETGEDFSTWEGVIAPSLKSTEIWEYEEPANNDPDGTGTNSTGFNLLGLGFIDNSGTFQLFMEQSYLWVRNKKDDNDFKSIIFDMSYTGILVGEKNMINNGCQIRCIKTR
jgi:uncharacterized protein (TIGR02145 family)